MSAPVELIAEFMGITGANSETANSLLQVMADDAS